MKMQQPINLIESRELGHRSPISHRLVLVDCTEAMVNNLDQFQYDTKLPLGYFYNPSIE